MEEIKLYKIHVFPYSKREGTRAADFEGQIAQDIKEKRTKKIIELSNNIQREYNKSYIGKKVKVLIEEKEGEYFKGHTSNYMYVLAKKMEENIQNKMVEIVIEDIQNEILVGSIIS